MRVPKEEKEIEQGDDVPPLRVPTGESLQNAIPVLTQEIPA